MKTTENAKKAYAAPHAAELDVVTCDLLSGSINSYDKDGSEEIKGEESLSNRNNMEWDDDGTWDNSDD